MLALSSFIACSSLALFERDQALPSAMWAVATIRCESIAPGGGASSRRRCVNESGRSPRCRWPAEPQGRGGRHRARRRRPLGGECRPGSDPRDPRVGRGRPRRRSAGTYGYRDQDHRRDDRHVREHPRSLRAAAPLRRIAGQPADVIPSWIINYYLARKVWDTAAQHRIGLPPAQRLMPQSLARA
jgi:hypothetical protein